MRSPLTRARYLFLDEVDAYPADVSGESDPVALTIQRTVTFRGRRKIVMISTPTLKGFSRIEAAYEEESDLPKAGISADKRD